MYCGITDIVHRWIYSRQGIHQLIKRGDFPAPAFTINKGRTKVWKLTDIEAFESRNPEVLDERAKMIKRAGYARALRKKAIGKEKTLTMETGKSLKKEVNGDLLYQWL